MCANNPRWQPSNRNYEYLRNYEIKIPTANLRRSTMEKKQKVYLGESNNDRQSKMAAGNTYISEIMWSAVKIAPTNLRYKTMQVENSVGKWVQQRPTTGNIDMAAKTGNNYTPETLTDNVAIPTPHMRFSMMTSSIKD